jgi:hypothetical protein
MFNYKIIFVLLIFVFVYKSNAVTEKDTVQLDANYVGEIWYNMQSGEVGGEDVNEWDIAFQTSPGGAGVLVNGQKGVRAWVVPGKTEDDWSKSIDTNGMVYTWESYINSEESWNIGAFNLGIDGNKNNSDFGWGKYNASTHAIYGNKIFVLRIDNKTYKKFMIEMDDEFGYTFKYSDLMGSNEGISKVNIKEFPDKNFAYFSFADNTTLDREPSNKDWHLVFGRYEGLADAGGGQFIPHNLTGVRQNNNILVAKLKGVNPKTVDVPAFTSDNFLTKITTIGSDWKKLNNSTLVYEVLSDVVYFVSIDTIGKAHPQIYRIFFTDFTGASTGRIIFEKEQMPVSVIENEGKPLGNFTIYPNIISSNDNLNIVYQLYENAQNIKIAVYSSTGEKVYEATENAQLSLNIINISNLNVPSGLYLVTFEVNGKIGTEKLIVE